MILFNCDYNEGARTSRKVNGDKHGAASGVQRRSLLEKAAKKSAEFVKLLMQRYIFW